MEQEDNKLYVEELDEVSAEICNNYQDIEKCKALNTYVKIYIEKDVIPVATYLILELAPLFKNDKQFLNLEHHVYEIGSAEYNRVIEHIDMWRDKYLTTSEKEAENE